MISQYFQSVAGISTAAATVLVLCIAAFLGIVVRVLRADAAHLRAMAALPLDPPGSAPDHPQEISR